MWSARASESSGVIGPTSRLTRPRLSRSLVRSLLEALGAASRAPAASTGRVYSAAGGFRRAFVRLRLRFASSRRSRALALGRGGDPAPGDGKGGAKLLDEALDCKLTVAELAPLVLRDRAQHGSGAGDDTAFLHIGECGRRLDVEHRLDPRGRLLGVLPSRPARPGHPDLDLSHGQRDGARDLNRLTLHGRHSARHRRCAPRVGRADPGRRRRRRGAAPRRARDALRVEQLDPTAARARGRAAGDGVRDRGLGAADDAWPRRRASSPGSAFSPS